MKNYILDMDRCFRHASLHKELSTLVLSIKYFHFLLNTRIYMKYININLNIFPHESSEASMFDI